MNCQSASHTFVGLGEESVFSALGAHRPFFSFTSEGIVMYFADGGDLAGEIV